MFAAFVIETSNTYLYERPCAALCWLEAEQKPVLIEKDYQQQLFELFDTSVERKA